MAITDRQATVVRRLANDISNSDAKVLRKVESFIKSPPALTPEALGFYPSGNETEFERVLRGTISTLDDTYLFSFEDKYMNEALWVLIDKKVIPKKHLKPKTLEVIEALTYGELDDVGGSSNLNAALIDIEEAIAQTGRALLSFDFGEGDTLFFFTLPTDKTAFWRDVELECPAGELPIAVRSADWQLFLTYLEYAISDFKSYTLPSELTHKPLRSINDLDINL